MVTRRLLGRPRFTKAGPEETSFQRLPLSSMKDSRVFAHISTCGTLSCLGWDMSALCNSIMMPIFITLYIYSHSLGGYV